MFRAVLNDAKEIVITKRQDGYYSMKANGIPMKNTDGGFIYEGSMVANKCNIKHLDIEALPDYECGECLYLIEIGDKKE